MAEHHYHHYDNNDSGLITGLIIGAVLGAGLALIWSTKNGKQFAEEFLDKIMHILDNFDEFMGEVGIHELTQNIGSKHEMPRKDEHHSHSHHESQTHAHGHSSESLHPFQAESVPMHNYVETSDVQEAVVEEPTPIAAEEVAVRNYEEPQIVTENTHLPDEPVTVDSPPPTQSLGFSSFRDRGRRFFRGAPKRG